MCWMPNDRLSDRPRASIIRGRCAENQGRDAIPPSCPQCIQTRRTECAMRLDTRQARLDLTQDQLATLTQACRTHIACLAGTAWITIDRDPRDVVLERGESFVVDSNANVVVTAL